MSFSAPSGISYNVLQPKILDIPAVQTLELQVKKDKPVAKQVTTKVKLPPTTITDGSLGATSRQLSPRISVLTLPALPRNFDSPLPLPLSGNKVCTTKTECELVSQGSLLPTVPTPLPDYKILSKSVTPLANNNEISRGAYPTVE